MPSLYANTCSVYGPNSLALATLAPTHLHTSSDTRIFSIWQIPSPTFMTFPFLRKFFFPHTAFCLGPQVMNACFEEGPLSTWGPLHRGLSKLEEQHRCLGN